MSAGAVRAGEAFVEIGARDRTQKVLRSAEKRLRSFGNTASSIGRGLAGIGTAGGVAIAGATSMLAGFDRQMAQVAAKTGATGSALDQLREKAKVLGSTTAFSASQAAEGMQFLAQAGFDAKQIMAAIPDVLNLAAAGGVELGMAADIASDVGTAFGLAADEIGRVADVMAVTASKSNTSVELLGETFKYVAPVAKAAGQSIEEVSAAAGLLGNSGIKGSQAGTDLKNVLVALANQDTGDRLAEMGVAITDATGKIRPLLDIMRDYGAATSDMSQQERLSNAMSIFGKISGKSALTLMNAGEQVEVLREQMYSASGAAERMAAVMQEGIHGSLIAAMSAAQGLAIEFGEALKPALMGIINAGTNVLRWATEFIKENRGVAIAIGVAAAAAGVLGAALMAVGAVIGAVASAVGVVSAALASPFLGPVLAAASAVGLLAYKLITSVAIFGSIIASSETLSGAFMAVVGVFKELGSTAIRTVSGIASALMSGNITKAAKILWAGLKLTFWTGVKAVLDGFMHLPRFMINVITGLTGWIWKVFTGTFSAIARGLTALATGSVSGLKSAIGMIQSTLAGEAPNFSISPTVNKDAAREELDSLLAEYKRKEPEEEKPATKKPAPNPYEQLSKQFSAQAGLPPHVTKALSNPAAYRQFGGEIPSVPAGPSVADMNRMREQMRARMQKALQQRMKQQDHMLGKSVTDKIDPDAGPKLDAAAERGGESIRGTTNAAAAALAAFTGDNNGNRIAKASEEQVAILREINDRDQERGEGGTMLI
ncbi:MAG: phage tail tape measure protein [Planctomycetota bacterium]